MAIADNLMTNLEVIMKGSAAAAGSNAKNVYNVFHFRRTTVINPFSKAQLEAAFQTNIALIILAALNVRYTQTSTSVRIMNDPLDQAVDFTRVIVASIAGDSMPMHNCAFLKVQTGIKGKSFRGRKFLGPISETDSTTTSDVLNAGAITRFGTVVSALKTPFIDAGPNTYVFSHFSRKEDELTVKPVCAAYDVTNVVLNKRIGRIGRRRPVSSY